MKFINRFFILILIYCCIFAYGMVYAQQDKTVAVPQKKGIFDDAMYGHNKTVISAKKVLIDDFEQPSRFNLLNGNTNVYMMAPSRIMMATVDDVRDGEATSVLKLKFLRASEGGPYDKGGWCGYYSSFVDMNAKRRRYFSATDFTYLTFYVKGKTGNENFLIGLADKHWESAGDSVKSGEVIMYLPEKKITKEWQKAKIPLTTFLLDLGKLASFAISFESECFSDGSGNGVVYIDDIAFE